MVRLGLSIARERSLAAVTSCVMAPFGVFGARSSSHKDSTIFMSSWVLTVSDWSTKGGNESSDEIDVVKVWSTSGVPASLLLDDDDDNDNDAKC